MPTTKIFCAVIVGIDATIVTVEVDLRHKGIPAFVLVGLPDTSIREAKERVMAAIRNSGFEFPSAKIIVNLAPADLPKEGSEFDLSIACGILAQEGLIREDRAREILKDYLFIGELSLDGSLRSVRGILGVALKAKACGLKGLVLPKENASMAALIESLEVIACDNLNQVLRWINGDLRLDSVKINKEKLLSDSSAQEDLKGDLPDLADIHGNTLAKKALEVAASGGHNMLMLGPPGVGKTLLAKALPRILPPLSFNEALELTQIYSALGSSNGYRSLVTIRPVRSPHHSASDIAIVGGGTRAQPGEITLAHHGVLFLDEMAEFPRRVLEALRQPLEEGTITVSRAAAKYQYPARFILVGAANPCLCGWWGSKDRECLCTPYQIMRYRVRFSGPLVDRMDLHVGVSTEEFRQQLENKKALGPKPELSRDVRLRVIKAREVQGKRFKSPAKLNAHMSPAEVKSNCPMENSAQEALANAMKKLNLSLRSYTKILKVARTLADLEDVKTITLGHVSSAMNMRCLDRTPNF